MNSGQHETAEEKKKSEESSLELKPLTNVSIPTNDRPMSLVQELDESAVQSDGDEEEMENNGAQVQQTQPKAMKREESPPAATTVKTTIKTSTVVKGQNPTTSRSISVEEIQKECPNLPRKT